MTCKPLVTPRNQKGTSSSPENTSKRVNMILERKFFGQMKSRLTCTEMMGREKYGEREK